jgi:hypothetical protein
VGSPADATASVAAGKRPTLLVMGNYSLLILENKHSDIDKKTLSRENNNHQENWSPHGQG